MRMLFLKIHAFFEYRRRARVFGGRPVYSAAYRLGLGMMLSTIIKCVESNADSET